jgi:hypothetical protein
MRYSKRTTCAGGWICHTRIRAEKWVGGIRSAQITNWSCRHGEKYLTYRYPRTQRIKKNDGTNRTYDVGAVVSGVGLWARTIYVSSSKRVS